MKKTESSFIFKDKENQNERGRVFLEREKNKDERLIEGIEAKSLNHLPSIKDIISTM